MIVAKGKVYLFAGNLPAAFREDLSEIVGALGFEGVHSVTWGEVASAFRAKPKANDIFVLDPSGEGFSVPELNDLITGFAERPRIVMIRTVSDVGELAEFGEMILEELLGLDASIRTDYSKVELAYVLRRLVFPSDEDSRSYPRALTALGVEFRSDDSCPLTKAEAFNLSVRSVFIKVDEPKAEGTLLDVVLHLKDGQDSLRCRGRVVFGRTFVADREAFLPGGMGVCFEDLDDDGKARLGQFVEDRLLRVDRDM